MKKKLTSAKRSFTRRMLWLHAKVSSRKAEGFVDSANKILIAVVIGALLLAGLLCFNPIKLFGVLAGLPVFILALVWKDRLGFGDVWLTVAAGFVVGFRHGLWAQIIAYSAMLLFFLGYRIYRKRKPEGKVFEQPYPLVPFLSLGFLAAYFL